MTNEQQSLSMIISEEELILLLRVMEATVIPGLIPNYLQGLEEDQIMLVMSTAERSLIGREILTLNDDDQLAIDRAALALIGPCVIPEKSIILSLFEKGDAPKPIYFHTSNGMIIEHTLVGVGLHRFAALATESMLHQQLTHHMQIGDQNKVSEKSFVLTLAELKDVLSTIRQNGSDEILSENMVGGPENLVELFDSGMKDTSVSANLFFIDHRDEESNQNDNSLSFFIGPNSIWEFDNGNLPDPENQVRIRSISTENVREKISNVLASSLDK